MKLNRIKEVLRDKGMTQVELASKLGASVVGINAVCQNRKQPKLEKLFLIASILDVRPSDLINDGQSQS